MLFLTPLQIKYMNMPFQIGPEQEQWLQQIEGKSSVIRVKLKDITSKENYNKIAVMRFENETPYTEIAAAIRKNPGEYFTQSV